MTTKGIYIIYTSNNNEMKRIEKIEVLKSTGIYHYTGYVTEYDKDNILIETIKGESCIFRKNQIQGRQIIKETQGNEKAQDNKSI